MSSISNQFSFVTIIILFVSILETTAQVNNAAMIVSKNMEANVPNVTFVPESARKVVELTDIVVTVIIDNLDVLPITDDQVFDPTMDINERLSFTADPIDLNVASIRQVTNLKRINQSNSYTFEFTIRAIILGKTKIEWSLADNFTGKIHTSGSYTVTVIRSPSSVNILFTIFVLIIVTFNNVNMGCLIEWKTIQGVLMKPIAPIIGFASQFIFMPLVREMATHSPHFLQFFNFLIFQLLFSTFHNSQIFQVKKLYLFSPQGSYLIGYLFFPNEISWRLGLFTLGCCPGGTGSNFWTLLFDGDVDLSVTMTFISTIAAMGMMPLWMFTLGAQLLEEGNVRIPYVNLLSSLVSMTVPLLIGLAIQKYKPTWAAFLRKLLKPFTAFVIIVLVIGGTWLSLYIFKLMTWSIVGAGLAVALSGYVSGAMLALVTGLKTSQVVAVSIETALQNPGVAFVLLQLSMEQPESDLAAIPIVAQLLMTGIPLWTTYLIYFIIKKCCCAATCGTEGSNKSSRTPSLATEEAKTTTEPLNSFV